MLNSNVQVQCQDQMLPSKYRSKLPKLFPKRRLNCKYTLTFVPIGVHVSVLTFVHACGHLHFVSSVYTYIANNQSVDISLTFVSCSWQIHHNLLPTAPVLDIICPNNVSLQC